MPRDALVFRHCVRSTPSDVKHVSRPYEQMSDYASVPMVDWPVPRKWCTPKGMDIMSRTGAHLRALLGEDVRLSVVSDTSMRDADSSLALIGGFCGARLPGCASLRYDPVLFEDSRDPDLGVPALCASPWTTEQRRLSIAQRMARVPYPMGLNESLSLLQSLIGVGVAGPLTCLPGPSVSADAKLHGTLMLLKSFGQQIFYAFASDLPYEPLRPPTVDELYGLLAWQHWERSVLKMNGMYAADNAALMRAVVDALNPEAPAGRPPDPSAALFVGHDGNVDGIGLLAGLREIGWAAPPYLSAGPLFPTPPGGALHFRVDDAREVTLRYAYPIYVNADGSLNESGVLHASPILLREPWAAFVRRIEANLETFAGARACYAAATERAARLKASMGSRYYWNAAAASEAVAAAPPASTPPASTGGGVAPPASTGGGVGPPASTGGGVAQPSSTGGGVGPPSSTGGGVAPPASTGGGVGPPSSTGGGVAPPSSTGGGVAPPSSTGGGVAPPSSTGGETGHGLGAQAHRADTILMAGIAMISLGGLMLVFALVVAFCFSGWWRRGSTAHSQPTARVTVGNHKMIQLHDIA